LIVDAEYREACCFWVEHGRRGDMSEFIEPLRVLLRQTTVYYRR